jgi:hypothetical protein
LDTTVLIRKNSKDRSAIVEKQNDGEEGVKIRDAHQNAVTVYDRIIEELRALPAGSSEGEVQRIHYAHQDALCAAVRATK